MFFVLVLFLTLKCNLFQILNKMFSFLFISVCVLIVFFIIPSNNISFCLDCPRNNTNNNFGLSLKANKNNLNVMNITRIFASFYAINCFLKKYFTLLEMQIFVDLEDWLAPCVPFFFSLFIYTLLCGPLFSFFWVFEERNVWSINKTAINFLWH